MANNGSKFPVPKVPDLSREETSAWNWIADHPLLDGQLIEDITLSTTTKHTRVPHALGRPYRGFIDVRGVGLTEDQSNPNKNKEIWLYKEESPVLLDYHEVTDTTAASVTFSNLEGDTDKVYQLHYYIVHGDGATDETFALQPNGLSTSQDGQRNYTQNATNNAADLAALPVFKFSASGFGVCTFFAQTGFERYGFSLGTSATNSATLVMAGVWNESTTEVTSLVVNSPNTLIGIGSKFWLYALHSRATKSSIWIF